MPSSSRIVFSEDVVGASPWRPETIEGDRRNGNDRRSAADRRAADEKPPEPSYEDGLRDGRAIGLEQARGEQAEVRELTTLSSLERAHREERRRRQRR